ncbi:MAG: adenosylcobinamide-phosphate synthase CbiB [Rhizobiaceae bacterium]|nr:adenosylcobinamide-phosphate synthase CbiB [Rhizobiaceae bacterium]
MSAPLAFLSLLIELTFGYPDRIVRAIGHPVIWIGKLISVLDVRLNRSAYSHSARKALGVLALFLLALVSGGVAGIVQSLLLPITGGIFLVAVLASTLIAQRSLASHVAAVARAVESGGVSDGRIAVSMIVGRDPDRLDEAGVCRAAIESLAENFSDGIVAPTFWLTLGGLPGAAIYKTVNTADSMIGHKTDRHGAFGWASARFDDLINLPASRLTALLVIVAAAIVPGANPVEAWRSVWRDAKSHRSPNAGWPEAAFAGALGLSLAGPRHYGGQLTTDAPMGRGKRDATSDDIRRALKLYWMADALLILLVGLIGFLIWHG